MAFFYFIYTLTLSDMARTYLSLDGNSTARACKLVPLIITNLVEGDINGNWATAESFSQNSSIFALSFSGTEITDEIYTSIMSRFKKQLKSLSGRSALRDAAWNAMAWATFGFQGKDTDQPFPFLTTSLLPRSTYLFYRCNLTIIPSSFCWLMIFSRCAKFHGVLFLRRCLGVFFQWLR